MNNRIKKYRELAGISQREAARLIGVPVSTYREWEYGRQIRDYKSYIKIARAFNISLDMLFGLKGIDASLDKDFEQLDKLVKSIRSKVLKI